MSTRPNILFILTDQMRGDCLSITGHPVVRTPNLDDLAGHGTVFTAAYSPCPSCIAARASIWTGLTPSSHGRLGYQDQVPWRYDDMLAERLSRAGYQTHCIGKTHYYPQRSLCGFGSLESYEGEQNFDGRYVNDYFEWLADRTNGRLTERDHGLSSNSWLARPSHLPEELHNNSWVAARAVEFLRRRDPTRPFFLNLSFHRPHPPIDPLQVFYDMYRDAPVPPVPVGDWATEHDVPVTDLNAWHGRLPDEVLAHSRRAYYAQIAHIDCQIGRVMRSIEKLRMGPTLVVFTADHGEMLGDHHLFRKVYAYEGSARVPLIVRPADRSAPRVCDAPVALHDLYPTFLEAAGVAIPRRTEGRSLLGFCGEGAERAECRDFVHGEHSACYHESNGMQFLTDGRIKYIWYTLSGREQLFDLTRDPDERRDLSADPSAADHLALWRQRLIEGLAPRESDGLCDGRRLIPGTNLPAVRPELLAT